MRLLHVSDIHFRHPECAGDTDPDRPYRTLLVNHARAFAREGRVDLIIVTGDIAYRGAAAEYLAALEWLFALADACGCPRDRIFVVPGNHDVDRAEAAKNKSTGAAQAAISGDDDPQHQLKEILQYSETGRALLAPLVNYNEFAARFSCQLFPPSLRWKADLPLQHGAVLRLHGLSSTALSGMRGKDDIKGELLLGVVQSEIDPQDGVVNAVLCHHPPDWFRDTDSIEDHLCNRAQLQFLGHRHTQRIVQEQRYVRFAAAAVNPDRKEAGFEPGYNVVDISVEPDGDRLVLKTESRLFAYQATGGVFAPKTDPVSGTGVWTSRSMIRGRALATRSAGTYVAPGTKPVEDPVATAEASQASRNIVFRFWKLNMSDRREIIDKLDLLIAEERKLPEAERYGRALLRAKERGLLDALVEEIARREKA